jgi:hypothetical protein
VKNIDAMHFSPSCMSVVLLRVAGQKFIEAEKQELITWYKVRVVWMVLRNFPLELFK